MGRQYGLGVPLKQLARAVAKVKYKVEALGNLDVSMLRSSDSQGKAVRVTERRESKR